MWQPLVRECLRASRRLDVAQRVAETWLQRRGHARLLQYHQTVSILTGRADIALSRCEERPWTATVSSCARALIESPELHSDTEEGVDIAIQVFTDINAMEMTMRHATAFKHACADRSGATDAASVCDDVLCDSILSALEEGTDDVDARVAHTAARLNRIVSRSQEVAGAELTALEAPSHGVTRQERLLLAVNDVLFRESGLAVTPIELAKRAAFTLGSGLEHGQLTPLAAALAYRSVLGHCDPSLETEVVFDDDVDDGAQVWLRVSSERGVQAEHHLVNLCAGALGSFARIFPKRAPDERTPSSPNPWAVVVQQLAEAREGMCDGCGTTHARKHPWPGMLDDLRTDLVGLASAQIDADGGRPA